MGGWVCFVYFPIRIFVSILKVVNEQVCLGVSAYVQVCVSKVAIFG